MSNPVVAGLDYGSDSVRCVYVNARSGEVYSSAVAEYPRWKLGLYCNPQLSMYRQHPLDYIETLIDVVHRAADKLPEGISTNDIVGMTIDTTGSTPVVINENLVPLALTDEFKDDPNAMFILWKDHMATQEAEEINQLAHSGDFTDYTLYSGGSYSSEWFFAKILKSLRSSDAVKKAAFSWIEHCDWMPAMLTGQKDINKIKRSRCVAGHKAMWNKTHGGYPSEEFLTELDPLLSGLRETLGEETYTIDQVAGNLSSQWAEKLSFPEGISVGIGALDAHMGAVGGGIKPGELLKVLGTSTCDMLLGSIDRQLDAVRGISGEVPGSIVPGYIGYEAGQSAFGDIYAWFKRFMLDLVPDSQKERQGKSFLAILDKKAAEVDISGQSVLALDWHNGRRTPFVDPHVKGAIFNLTLSTSPVEVYRALVESTCFGAKAILDCFESQGVEVNSIRALGGIASKSSFVMQTLSDVLQREIIICDNDQVCALGAAMGAAVCTGIYETIEDAQKVMSPGIAGVYQPDKEKASLYLTRYKEYQRKGEIESS